MIEEAGGRDGQLDFDGFVRVVRAMPGLARQRAAAVGSRAIRC